MFTNAEVQWSYNSNLMARAREAFRQRADHIRQSSSFGVRMEFAADEKNSHVLNSIFVAGGTSDVNALRRHCRNAPLLMPASFCDSLSFQIRLQPFGNCHASIGLLVGLNQRHKQSSKRRA